MYQLPRAVGPLTIERRQGSDGVVDTYRGIWHSHEERPVVVRRLKDWIIAEPEVQAAIEVRVGDLRALHHRRLVRILDYIGAGKERFIVEESVGGIDLMSLVREVYRAGGTLPRHVALHLAIQMCTSLDALHNQRGAVSGEEPMLHRALRPGAVFIGADGAVQLGAFGLVPSPNLGPKPSLRDAIREQVAYLAPEQVDDGREISRATDIFSAGCVIYTLLTGDVLFDASNHLLATIQKRQAEVEPALAAVKGMFPGIDQLLRRCLYANPAKRYQSAAILAEELRQLVPHGARGYDPSLVLDVLESVGVEVVRPPPPAPPDRTASRASRDNPFSPASGNPHTNRSEDRNRSLDRTGAHLARGAALVGASAARVTASAHGEPGPMPMPTPRGAPDATAGGLGGADAERTATGARTTRRPAGGVSAWDDSLDEFGADVAPAFGAVDVEDDEPTARGHRHPEDDTPDERTATDPELTRPMPLILPPPLYTGSYDDAVLDELAVSTDDRVDDEDGFTETSYVPEARAFAPPTMPDGPSFATRGARRESSPLVIERTARSPAIRAETTQRSAAVRGEDGIEAPSTWVPPTTVSHRGPAVDRSAPTQPQTAPPTVALERRPGVLGLFQAATGLSLLAFVSGVVISNRHASPTAPPPPVEARAVDGTQASPAAAATIAPAAPGATAPVGAATVPPSPPGAATTAAPPQAGQSHDAPPNDAPLNDAPPNDSPPGARPATGVPPAVAEAPATRPAEPAPNPSVLPVLAEVIPPVPSADAGWAPPARLDTSLGERAAKGKLSAADRALLERIDTSHPDYSRSRVWLFDDASARRAVADRKRYIDELLRLPENALNPVYLLDAADVSLDREDWRGALTYTQKAEQHWGRLPSAAVFKRKATLCEQQATAWYGIYNSSRDPEALGKSLAAWQRYRDHVGSRDAGMAARADAQIARLTGLGGRTQ